MPGGMQDGVAGGAAWAEESRPPERWILEAADPVATARVAEATGLPTWVARILVARGHVEAEAVRRFLSPDLRTGLHDPFELKGMREAVERLAAALERGERVTVYGDYDVDGVTSTAALVSFLRAVGGEADFYIPRRLEEGYGLNLEAVEHLARRGTRLLVTCDCGVTAVDEVDRAVDLGVDVIIVDHHKVPAELPRATAVLNPYQPGCGFRFPHMAAVGVTFHLLMALRRHLREGGWFERRGLVEPRLVDWLDLVALGTVADVVPLQDVNRLFVSAGLERLSRGRRAGVLALREASGLPEGEPVTAGQVGFRLGPRINAAGRLSDATAGLELLLTSDPALAERLAGLLDAANRERQSLERDIVAEAVVQAEAQAVSGVRALVLAGAGWHRGVVGIVASRIVERFHLPTLVLGVEDGVARGSGRSIPALDLHEALEACAAHLTRFGGHRAAAGLELPEGALEAFRREFQEACAARLTEDDLVPRRVVDVVVEPEALTHDLHRALSALAPFGMGNATPVLVARSVRLRGARRVGQGDPGHLKARLGPVDVIGFGLGDRVPVCEGGAVDVAFTLGVDRWQGRERLQVRLSALHPAGTIALEEAAAPRRTEPTGHVHGV